MKIRNVELLRTSQQSVGSADSSSLDELTMMLSSSSRSHAASATMEDAVQSLSLALQEMHTELRDKTTECEVLYETANALSCALKESELLLAEKTLECEKLTLKLQMVTFREVDDDPMTLLVESPPYAAADATMNDIIEEAEAMLARSSLSLLTEEARLTTNMSRGSKQAEIRTPESKISTGNKKKVPAGSSASTSATSSNKSKLPTKSRPMEDANPNERFPGPVSVDDAFLEHDETELSSAEFPKPAEVRQAHFYQVIQERDKALQTVKKLSKEVKYTRKKNEELKSRLDRSTVLNELAYLQQRPPSRKMRIVKQDSQQLLSPIPLAAETMPEYPMGTTTSSSKSRPHVARQLSWLRRGKDIETHHNSNKINVATDAMSSRDDGSEQEYLRAIASNDADRAAGCDFERANL